VFDNPRRKPYDYIDFVAELNVGGTLGLESVQIRGNLFSWPLGSDKTSPNHVLAVVQHFEYLNNTAYKFGSQALGPALMSRFRLSDRLTRRPADGVVGLLLAGINSEYSPSPTSRTRQLRG
jgi:hypothetical protein